MMTTYYKVCRNLFPYGELVSACVEDDDLAVFYKIGEKTFPKLGYLFAFNNKESAIDFLSLCDVAYECEIEPAPVEDVQDIFIPGAPHETKLSSALLSDFWKLLQSGRKAEAIARFGVFRPPYGTVFCKSITLLREVSRV